MGIIARMKRKGLQWTDRPPKWSILSIFNPWMEECGATVVAPWQWAADVDHCAVSLQDLNAVPLAAHRVRVVWRWFTWNKFFQGKRRGIPEFESFVGAQFFRVNWGNLKLWISGNAEMRSLACGAMLSPYAMAVAGAEHIPHNCCWDGCEISPAGFRHIVWACPRRVKHTVVPVNSVDARFGWLVL